MVSPLLPPNATLGLASNVDTENIPSNNFKLAIYFLSENQLLVVILLRKIEVMFVTHLCSVLFLLTLVCCAAFFQLSVLIWSILIGASLIVISVFHLLPAIPLIAFWLGFIAVAGFANLAELRRKYIVGPMIPKLQAQMPPISATERVAIEAGDTWWEKDLFCGRPDWKKLLAYPKPTLSAEEQSFLDNQVEQVCAMVSDFDVLRKRDDLSPETWAFLKKEKFFGMVMPKEYGGLGFSALAHSTVVCKLATRSITLAVTVMVPNSLGPGELLVHYGTEEQKNYYLPRLARGEEMPCFALTGPDAGSDAGAIPDKGIVCRGMHEGKEVLGMRLTWDKRYITLAPVATVLGLAIQLYDPDHLLGNKEDIGITLCLIPTNHPGVEIGYRHLPMYLMFMNGPTRGNDVFIPLDWIVGGQKMAGQGWRMLMECLSIGRSISLPALATASSKVAYRLTGAYSKVRKQFNTSISSFEGVQEALGYISGLTYTNEATRIMSAGAIDLHINPSIVSAITKCHLTENGRTVVDHAMDVHGGHGIQMGPRNELGNLYAGIPISITVEGANILSRNLIIFGQGAIRCHPYILQEVELLTSEKPDVVQLDKTLMGHIGFFAANFIRSLTYGLTGGHFIFATFKNRRIAKLQRQLTRMSTALALWADSSLILLGGSLKRRERISARLGDILSQLYLASAVLKYYRDNGEQDVDVNNVCWSLRECLYQIQIACDELAENYPNRIVGKLLQAIIFPFGKAYPAPSDKLHASVIEPMLSQNDFRKRVLGDIYISKHDDDITKVLEQALADFPEVDPLYRKVHKAVQHNEIPAFYDFEQRVHAAVDKKIITSAEADLMLQYEKLRTDVVKVNEFSFDLSEVLA